MKHRYTARGNVIYPRTFFPNSTNLDFSQIDSANAIFGFKGRSPQRFARLELDLFGIRVLAACTLESSEESIAQLNASN